MSCPLDHTIPELPTRSTRRYSRRQLISTALGTIFPSFPVSSPNAAWQPRQAPSTQLPSLNRRHWTSHLSKPRTGMESLTSPIIFPRKIARLSSPTNTRLPRNPVACPSLTCLESSLSTASNRFCSLLQNIAVRFWPCSSGWLMSCRVFWWQEAGSFSFPDGPKN